MADELRDLEFTEHPGEIITIRVSGVPMRDYFAIVRAQAALGDGDAGAPVEAWEHLFRTFGDAGVVVAWSYPEEPNGEGMLARDFTLGQAIVREWRRAVRDVPLPLPLTASAGTPSTREPSPSSSTSPSSATGS